MFLLQSVVMKCRSLQKFPPTALAVPVDVECGTHSQPLPDTVVGVKPLWDVINSKHLEANKGVTLPQRSSHAVSPSYKNVFLLL